SSTRRGRGGVGGGGNTRSRSNCTEERPGVGCSVLEHCAPALPCSLTSALSL
ncbi:hypothetical protein J6590_021040, partial [Homalodisca vitripennis]